MYNTTVQPVRTERVTVTI
uniref:Uncharacterized protein n=1 Tax=Arundo donax TaxID=35708 RepID=A0A0A9AQ79_ARUDO